jgi:hypothetical protein
LPDDAADGAQVVLRYVPKNGEANSANWSLEIVHSEQRTEVPWENQRSSVWERQGLCRVVVQGDKFGIIFPEL